MKNKKVDYFIIFALILSLGGSIKYLLSYINNKQTIDLVACLIISTTFVALIISLIIVKIIKNKNKKIKGVIHLKIINTMDKIYDIYSNESFDINKWKDYINNINPKIKKLCIQDMNEALNTGQVNYQMDFLPILNDVIKNKEKLLILQNNFNTVTYNLNEKIINKFGKPLSVEIVLYLGLCNGAGWVEKIDNKVYCLLGIEKILELNWYDINSLYGLIYHELGHVYQNQYGLLERNFNDNKKQFLWQLFTEGIAMYFEQTLIGDYEYYHQDKNGWKDWCDNNINQIINDFKTDLNSMTFDNQRYFGDWVYYHNHSDVGYYLGTKFVQYICEKNSFDDILSFEIETVEKFFQGFNINISKNIK